MWEQREDVFPKESLPNCRAVPDSPLKEACLATEAMSEGPEKMRWLWETSEAGLQDHMRQSRKASSWPLCLLVPVLGDLPQSFKLEPD